MRYFLLLTDAKPALSFRVTVPAGASGAVAFGRSVQRGGARKIGAAIRAINVTAVAVTTDNDLAVATCAVKHPGIGLHRSTKPMSAGFLPVLVRPWTGCAKARFGA